LLLSFLATNVNAQDDLNVISGKNQWLHFTDSRNSLYNHLASEAFDILAERGKKVQAINSRGGWEERQQWIRKTLDKAVGPFPQKTPLNAKTTRTVEKDFYIVEHIVYESQPAFYVTSSLFIPKSLKKKERAPAIIYCSGHSEEGYRSKVYQHVILNLVKKGFVVFAFDPVGQGERLEYFDDSTGKSTAGGPTNEHSIPGTQAFITGNSQARYMIWDGIRAVDYLLTRKEIDPSRIGITGRSGGGTQSSYIAAFDERIAAAAPECYITNFTRLLQSIGPQDAEQNFLSGIREGLDHGDLLTVRAPKPALMITTTRDIFSIEGARETAAEVARVYESYAKSENFSMVEDDAPHASTKKNREALYAFFQKHFNHPGSPEDEEVPLLTKEEIQVTKTGQVSTSLGGQTVFALNRADADKSMSALKKSRADLNTHLQQIPQNAKLLSGYLEPHSSNRPVFTGRLQRNGYTIEKYFFRGEGDYVVPFLRLVPDNKNSAAILYLHPDGKAANADAGGQMESLALHGYEVWAPDLPGTGELGGGDFKGDAFIGGISHNTWYTGALIGRSVVGIQAADLTRLLKIVKDQPGIHDIHGFATREMAPVMLHAAVFNAELKSVALIEPLISYHSLVSTRSYQSSLIMGSVPRQLQSYDLPDLAAAIAPRGLAIIDPLDGTGKKAEQSTIAVEATFIRNAFVQQHAGEKLFISGDDGNKIPVDFLRDLQR
jgi:cephalosporin-C deacetylase-like acetyl esterase